MKLTKKVLSLFLTLCTISILIFPSLKVKASNNNTGELGKLFASSPAVDNLSAADIAGKAVKYASYVGTAVKGIKGAIDAYDEDAEWYDNVFNMGAGAVLNILGLVEEEDPRFNAIECDIKTIKNNVSNLSSQISYLNQSLESLERSIDNRFKEFASLIISQITQNEYKQYLNNFTQPSSELGYEFSYYTFKDELNEKFDILVQMLDSGNEENIKIAYDNLYKTAIKIQYLYNYIMPNGRILTDQKSIQDLYYEYTYGNDNYVENSINFSLDLYNTYTFAEACLISCYNYQLAYALENNKDYYDYYVFGDSSLSSIPFYKISEKVENQLLDHNEVIKEIAKYLSVVQDLDGEYVINNDGKYTKSIPFEEISDIPLAFSSSTTIDNQQKYYRNNNRVIKGMKLFLKEMPSVFSSILDLDSFKFEIANYSIGKAKINSKNEIEVLGGKNQQFTVNYLYEDKLVYSMTFIIVEQEYSGGLGIDGCPYVIANKEDFIKMLKKSYSNQYVFSIENDIDLEGENIYNYNTYFNSILRGNGHKITNYKVINYDSSSSTISMFREIDVNGEIRDLVLGEKNTLTKYFNEVKTTLKTSLSQNKTINYSESSIVGGIAGTNRGYIFNCVLNTINFSTNGINTKMGGLVGVNYGYISHCELNNCKLFYDFQHVNMGVTPEIYVGGLVGKLVNWGTYNFCIFNGYFDIKVISSFSCNLYFGNLSGYNTPSMKTSVYDLQSGSKVTFRFTTYWLQNGYQNEEDYGLYFNKHDSLSSYLNVNTYYGYEENWLKDRGDGNLIINHDMERTTVIKALPVKSVYEYGETFNPNGLLSYFYLGNVNSRFNESFTNYTVEGFNSSQLGEQTIKLKTDKGEILFDILVVCNHKFEYQGYYEDKGKNIHCYICDKCNRHEYIETDIEYTISWKLCTDYENDEYIIVEEKYKYGEMPEYKGELFHPFMYYFFDWDKKISPAYYDVTYTAEYFPNEPEGTITNSSGWQLFGENIIVSLDYNSTAETNDFEIIVTYNPIKGDIVNIIPSEYVYEYHIHNDQIIFSLINVEKGVDIKIADVEITPKTSGEISFFTEVYGYYVSDDFNSFIISPKGDINGDGKVNNKDVTTFMKYLAKWKNITVVEQLLDVNNDGKVNNKDITRLMKYLSGWYNALD